MAKKGPRQLIKMRSTESSHMYLSVKNRRNDPNRMELKKYDPTLRRHVVYREAKSSIQFESLLRTAANCELLRFAKSQFVPRCGITNERRETSLCSCYFSLR